MLFVLKLEHNWNARGQTEDNMSVDAKLVISNVPRSLEPRLHSCLYLPCRTIFPMYFIIIEGEQVPELNTITRFAIEVHKVLDHCFVKKMSRGVPKSKGRRMC